MTGKLKAARKVALAAIVFTLTAAEAHALTTIGDRSCGQWANRKQNQIVQLVVENWFLGMMNGMAVGTNTDQLAKTDDDSMNLWMDNYCQAHPLEHVSSGAIALFVELSGKKQ